MCVVEVAHGAPHSLVCDVCCSLLHLCMPLHCATTATTAQGTPTIQQLKVRYYELSIQYNGHNNNYLEMARNYRAIYETSEVAADEALWTPVLKKICWLVVMAPADSDQVTLLQLTKEDKKLASLPLYKQLLDSFTQQEVRSG